MELDCENPWQVENIDAFNFLCCPECVFRSKEQSSFQDHALGNHPKSVTLFQSDILSDIDIKQDPLEVPQHEIKVEEANEIQNEHITTEQIQLPSKLEVDENKIFLKEDESNHHQNQSTKTKKKTRSRKKVTDPLLNNVQTYPCSRCDKTFSKKVDLNLHVKKNHGVPCKDCDMTFENGFKLRSHIWKVHEPRKYDCCICDESFTKEQAMQDHVKEHKNKPCGYCGKKIEDPFKLRLHILENHEHEIGRKCFECDKVFTKRHGYVIHKKSIHAEKPDKLLKCDHCEYTTFFRHYLTSHIIKCPKTESGLKKIEELRIIRKNKEGKTYDTNDSFTCIKCDETFESSRSYITHFRCFHDGHLPPECQNATKFFCDKCPRVFMSKLNLKEHYKRVHTENKETIYKCTVCDEDFTLKPYIDHYRSIHKSMPPDVKDKKILFCDKCPLYYFSRHGFKRHCLTHNEDTKSGNHECQDCSKKFRSSENLKEHKNKVHLKITPYECDQCPKKYGTRKYLKKHKSEVHSKVTCDICNKEIYNPFELKKHKAAAHGIYPPGSFRCDQCPMFFTIESNLLNHKESKH